MSTLIILIFVLGYIMIAAEHTIKINKAASAILTAVLCWTFYILFTNDKSLVNEQLNAHLGDISGILFFLLSAMTIVELIDLHDGFQILTEKIKTKNKRKLFWIISIITFMLSAVLDNLTTTIVMVSLLRKLITDRMDRLYFVGIIIIAANAGGAWSPIGDVTTTMLWIGHQISTAKIIESTLISSIISLLVPMFLLVRNIKGNINHFQLDSKKILCKPREQKIVLFTGVASFLFVPLFKTYTHLPPFIGILFGLSALWITTELLHNKKDPETKGKFTVFHALQKIDATSILFFLGILLAIGALGSIGVLTQLAVWLNTHFGNFNIIALSIGLMSAIIDNVPLVAASQGMFSLTSFPSDHSFWTLLAYTAGTGGSCLIIGSAAGVAAMGMENISFVWYLKRISWAALLGYLAGFFIYLAQQNLFN